MVFKFINKKTGLEAIKIVNEQLPKELYKPVFKNSKEEKICKI